MWDLPSFSVICTLSAVSSASAPPDPDNISPKELVPFSCCFSPDPSACSSSSSSSSSAFFPFDSAFFNPDVLVEAEAEADPNADVPLDAKGEAEPEKPPNPEKGLDGLAPKTEGGLDPDASAEDDEAPNAEVEEEGLANGEAEDENAPNVA